MLYNKLLPESCISLVNPVIMVSSSRLDVKIFKWLNSVDAIMLVSDTAMFVMGAPKRGTMATCFPELISHLSTAPSDPPE